MNPYSSPISDGPPHARGDIEVDAVVTPRIMAAMNQTRPWVTFLAVLGFVSAALMVFVGLAMAFAAPAAIPGGRFIGLVYLIPAVLYGVGSNFLYRYRGSMRSLQAGYGVEALENALEHQKSFWRFIGITSAVVLGIYGLGIIVAVVFGVFAAM